MKDENEKKTVWVRIGQSASLRSCRRAQQPLPLIITDNIFWGSDFKPLALSGLISKKDLDK